MITARSRAFDGSVAMRRLLAAVMMMSATAVGAQAADMPDFLRGSLPGSTPTRNWDGWYAGGQVGETWTNTDYGGSIVPLVNELYRNSILQTPVSQINVLGRVNAHSPGFGAFVGRNYQFSDVVLGVEANYTYMSNLASSDSETSLPIVIANPGIVFGPNGRGSPVSSSITSATLQGQAALRIKDEMTFRGRAGWATGDFLPYAFGGLAVGRMDVSRTASNTLDSTVLYADKTQNEFLDTQTATEGKTNAFVLGWTAGLGMEYMLWGNVFARVEWEYVKFMTVKDMAVTQNTARLGLGYRF
jgi:opacity protein-like surface antigen